MMVRKWWQLWGRS